MSLFGLFSGTPVGDQDNDARVVDDFAVWVVDDVAVQAIIELGL